MAVKGVMRIFVLVFPLMLFCSSVFGADFQFPGIDINVKPGGQQEEVATAIKIIAALTILSLAPAMLIVMTSFTRIIIVLAMLRHAFGMQQTPPNTVLMDFDSRFKIKIRLIGLTSSGLWCLHFYCPCSVDF